jgi:hypothetical protein
MILGIQGPFLILGIEVNARGDQIETTRVTLHIAQQMPVVPTS